MVKKATTKKRRTPVRKPKPDLTHMEQYGVDQNGKPLYQRQLTCDKQPSILVTDEVIDTQLTIKYRKDPPSIRDAFLKQLDIEIKAKAAAEAEEERICRENKKLRNRIKQRFLSVRKRWKSFIAGRLAAFRSLPRRVYTRLRGIRLRNVRLK